MIVLEPHQEKAARWLSWRERGLVILRAGGGKTLIASGGLSKVVARGGREKMRVGWLANTLEQCEQGRKALSAFPNLAGIEATVCCPAGWPRGLDPGTLDVMIVDECQHAGAETWSEIIERAQGYVWLFSATPFHETDTERNARLRAMCDNQIHEVPREATANRIVPAHVYLLTDTDSGLEEKIDEAIAVEMNKRKRFSRMSEKELYIQVAPYIAGSIGILPNKARNAAIVRMAAKHADESTLILVSTIDHGEKLQERIPDSVLCFSKMGKKARRDAIASFRDGGLRCMIATSLADEGLDVPIASVLIMAGAGRSARAAEQRTGRVLRAHPGKTHGVIYDFADKQHRLLANQSAKRQSVYRKLGYFIHDAKYSTPLV